MGLCFGLKGEQDFHGVLLHHKGFMDISTNRGGVWEVLDHRSVPVGDTWHRLRIDVAPPTRERRLLQPRFDPRRFISARLLAGARSRLGFLRPLLIERRISRARVAS